MVVMNQQVLVTGATGLVGQNLIKRLLAEGAKVRATLHHTPARVDDPAIEYVKGDLTRNED